MPIERSSYARYSSISATDIFGVDSNSVKPITDHIAVTHGIGDSVFFFFFFFLDYSQFRNSCPLSLEKKNRQLGKLAEVQRSI
jgi:hypothetical protein